MKGTKTGGRVKGTPNKVSIAFKRSLAALDFSMPEELVKLYRRAKSDGIRLRLLALMIQWGCAVPDDSVVWKDRRPTDEGAGILPHPPTQTKPGVVGDTDSLLRDVMQQEHRK